MSNDMERERFEAWCLSEGSPFHRWSSPIATQRIDDDTYCYMPVGNAWSAWQAARATPAPAEAQAEPSDLLTRIVAILDGIDRQETDENSGYWETSTGAAFGAGLLVKIKAALAAPPAPSEKP